MLPFSLCHNRNFLQHQQLKCSSATILLQCFPPSTAIFQIGLLSHGYKQTGTNSSLGNHVLFEHGIPFDYSPEDAPQEVSNAKVTKKRKHFRLCQDKSWLPEGNCPMLIIFCKPIYLNQCKTQCVHEKPARLKPLFHHILSPFKLVLWGYLVSVLCVDCCL